MARQSKSKPVAIGEAENQARPSDDRRLRIVAAAQGVFSEQGYDAGTLREIASRAGVPLSLITYHFADKLGLYRAVFEARVPQLVQQRLAGLALADLEADPGRQLDLIVKALLVPMLALRVTEDGRVFATLLARAVADPSPIQRDVVRGLMGPVTSGFLSRLKAALPMADETAALWAYGSMIGAMLYMLGGGGSMKDVTNGLVDPDDVRACTDQLVGIALAGFRR